MVRKATAADIDRVTEIYDKIHTEEEAGRITTGWARGVYPVRQTAEQALARGELFVLEENGRVMASGVINQNQVPEYADCPWTYPAADDQVLVLHTLTVDPEASGRGYAKQCVAYYEDCARQQGCSYLRMDTQVKNTVARRLYGKLGYAESGMVDCVFNGIPNVKLVCLEKKL